jgi:hypothetical protein
MSGADKFVYRVANTMGNATCTEEIRLPDPWISTHTLLPLALVALARIEPLIVVLMAYVWESVESVAFLCWSDRYYEHPLNSVVLDPAAALLGILVGRALAPARGYRRLPPRSELASTALLCLPSTLLWAADPPPTALFAIAWCAAVVGTFRSGSPSSAPPDGDPPLSDASRRAIVAFALVHVASVARVEWGHLWNGALAAAAVGSAAVAGAAAAKAPARATADGPTAVPVAE